MVKAVVDTSGTRRLTSTHWSYQHDWLLLTDERCCEVRVTDRVDRGNDDLVERYAVTEIYQ